MIEVVVFNMLDKDRDEEISKKDLFRLFNTERESLVVYPYTIMRAVELLELDRADKINKNDFIIVNQKVPYITFPAFRFQQ
jgi:hypothetical protein